MMQADVVVIGSGTLKPNMSTLVAELYPEGGARREMALAAADRQVDAAQDLRTVLRHNGVQVLYLQQWLTHSSPSESAFKNDS